MDRAIQPASETRAHTSNTPPRACTRILHWHTLLCRSRRHSARSPYACRRRPPRPLSTSSSRPVPPVRGPPPPPRAGPPHSRSCRLSRAPSLGRPSRDPLPSQPRALHEAAAGSLCVRTRTRDPDHAAEARLRRRCGQRRWQRRRRLHRLHAAYGARRPPARAGPRPRGRRAGACRRLRAPPHPLGAPRRRRAAPGRRARPRADLPPLPAPPASAPLTALRRPCAASAPRAGVGAAERAAWVLPAASAAAAAAVGAQGPPHSPAGGAGEGPQRPTYQYLCLGDEKMRAGCML